MVSKASDDLPEPERPVKTTSLSRGIDRVTFLRLCSRAPRIVIWSVGAIGTLGYSFSLVTANVPLAVATSRPSLPSTRQCATIVRRPAWTTRPVARSLSPTFAALMKLTFRSKLIARTTPSVTVRSDRPIAESARALIMPPCTKPEWLAMSSVGVISTVAVPSAVSTSPRPSHSHARETDASFASDTSFALRHRHAGRGVGGDQPALEVEDVGLAEEQRLLDLHHPAHRAQPALDHRPEEVDLELDRGVPHPILLQRRERHAHRGVRDLGDHATLHHARALAVLRSGLELEHHAAGLRLGDARPEELHPPVAPVEPAADELGRPSRVLHPRAISAIAHKHSLAGRNSPPMRTKADFRLKGRDVTSSSCGPSSSASARRRWRARRRGRPRRRPRRPPAACAAG